MRALGPARRPQLEQELSPVPGEQRRDRREQEPFRQEPAEVAAEEGGSDRRRCDPGGDPPVDATGSGVGGTGGERGRGADGDVRPGRSRGARRGEEERR